MSKAVHRSKKTGNIHIWKLHILLIKANQSHTHYKLLSINSSHNTTKITSSANIATSLLTHCLWIGCFKVARLLQMHLAIIYTSALLWAYERYTLSWKVLAIKFKANWSHTHHKITYSAKKLKPCYKANI